MKKSIPYADKILKYARPKPWFNTLQRLLLSYNFYGTVAAIIFFWASLVPSLLPRPWLMQALMSAVAIMIGYGCGTLLQKLSRLIGIPEPKRIRTIYTKRITVVILVIITIAMLALWRVWQTESHLLVNQIPPTVFGVIQMLLTASLLSYLLIVIIRVLKLATIKVQSRINVFLPRWIGNALGIIVITVLLILIFNNFLYAAFIRSANTAFKGRNLGTEAGVIQPSSPLRSGSEASLITWDSLGRQGRNFVAAGPVVNEINRFTGQTDALEPIRLYAGVDSAETAAARAQLIVAELRRTGAFAREVLVVATPTGSGWIESEAVESIEYMHGGNTAFVAQQYSYLPSWLSFVVDQNVAKESGQALFDAVYTTWLELPVESRPKLYTYGLSLGSFGGQAAFTSLDDVSRSVNGALFIGAPNNTDLWRQLTDRRDKGSLEWQPSYNDGRDVRWASSSDDIASFSSWPAESKVLYLQHASDPIVWWSPSLILDKPDWLDEPRGPDVSPQTHWYPFISFFHITIDQMFGVNVPVGHGHNYADVLVESWALLTQPENWSPSKAQKLEEIIL